jgi:F-type H+-transporting ATPase subunit b
MDLDATSFALEIVNFLVLLWLLNRFLFRPLRAALDARDQAAAKQAQDLLDRRAALDEAAAGLKAQQADWAARRDSAERELAADLAAQRQKRLDELARELATERDKARARLEQDRLGARQRDERELRQRAGRFVAGYLARLATPSVEAALIELFLADLAQQSGPAREALRAGWDERHEAAPTIDLCTAFEPPAELRQRVEAQIAALVGQPPRTEWRIDPDLIAGLCVHLPGHQLEASLRRGVDAFAAEAQA